MKAIWKGTVSFGLVNIPIELYSAIQEHSFGFKLLHSECHTPITNKRWCSHCNRDVEWNETVKGFKLPDDTYFLITPETLEKLKPEKSDSINITEFIDSIEISPLYYDKHYYMLPGRKSDKAFFLFIAALEDLKKIAIGQFVMKDKQYLCAIQPFKKGFLLTTLNYTYEIKQLNALDELEVPTITPEELKLAEQLINQLYKKKFNLSKYKDTFVSQLKHRIETVAKGVPIPKKEKVIPHKEETSLIEALKKSLTLDTHAQAK